MLYLWLVTTTTTTTILTLDNANHKIVQAIFRFTSFKLELLSSFWHDKYSWCTLKPYLILTPL